MQPFDYRIAVQDPLQMALAGYQQGQNFQQQRVQNERETQLYDMEMQQYQANQAKLQQEQARAQQLQANMADFVGRSERKELVEGDYERFLAENYELPEPALKALEGLNERQLQERTRSLTQVSMLMANDVSQPDENSLVVKYYREQQAAAEASGDPQRAALADAAARTYMSNPEAAKVAANATLLATDPTAFAAVQPFILPKPKEAASSAGKVIADYNAGLFGEVGSPEAMQVRDDQLTRAGGGVNVSFPDIFGKGAARGGEVFKVDTETGEIVSVAIEGGDLDTQRTNAIAAADLMLNNLNAILEDEGAPSRYGMSSVGGRIPPLPGTPGARAQARINQLGGQIFISAYEALKGGGSITNIETAKAERAITILLDQNIGWTDAQAALKDLADVVTAQKSRLEKANKSPATTGALTPAAGTTVVPEAAARYGITPEIWANMTPDKKAAFED